MKRFVILVLAVVSINLWGLDTYNDREEIEQNQSIRPLSCIQDLQLSIGPMGYTVLTPQMILSDTFANYSPFEVLVNGENTDTITCDFVNSSVMVTVRDTRNGNSCWSNIHVEDKLPPVIDCINDTLPCYVDPFGVDYSNYAVATDNCDDDVELSYAFFFFELGCTSDEFVSYTELRWTAEDDQGLRSQCVSRVFFARLDLDDTEFPDDTVFYCPLPDSLISGVPTIDSMPLHSLCDLVAIHRDDTIQGACNGNYTINRTWTAIDYCTNDMISDLQVISIVDTIPPAVLCADTVTIGTESSSCTGLYVVPEVYATDDCSEDSLITYGARLVGLGIVNVGDTLELDTGYYDLILYATDDCGNVDSCSQVLHIIDDVGPVLFCIPELEIYVDSMGEAPELCVEDLDHINHYFDNCGIDSILIAKMVDFCDTTMNNQFGFCVNFCCADVGNEVMVVIKVQDFAGNMNFCMINTMVLDTIAPIITSSPPDTTISCTVDYTDTTNTGGGIEVYDNCAEVLTIKITDSVDIDACKEGTVIRTFIACDPSGNADTAVQIITIENNFVFDSSLIFWAQDTCVETCPPDSLPETIGSRTYVMGDSCDVAVVSFTDVDITDTSDVCQVIERTWNVRNECGDTVDIDSVQIITFKNFKAPLLSGPPTDTTIMASGDSCGAFVVLPRLVATDCSSGLVVTNDCTMTGDSIAMFFPLGSKTITFTAIDACGNVSTFQTTVNVIDNEGPVLVCPPDTVIGCGFPTDTSITGSPMVMDNCDTIIGMAVMFQDSVVDGSCPQEMTIFRIFTASDSSGNMATCVQMISVVDTISPVINCPADVTISCEQPTTSDQTGRATATDNCDLLLGPIMESDSIVSGSCPSEMMIFRTFTVMDDCGNRSSCQQLISVIDETPPVITCPPDTLVECSEFTDPGTTGMPTVTDNCDPNPEIVFADSVVTGMGQTLRVIFRTWTAQDTCGNIAECQQVITVRDTSAPMLVCPPDLTVGCDTPLTDLTIFGIPDTSDNCLGITLIQDTIIDLDLCNVGSITRIFIARDSVGNSTMCEQIITVILNDSLLEEDIIWPDSLITVDACTGIDPDSAAVGMPVIDSLNAGCFRVSITFEDSIDYNCNAGICSTLVRKWTVIDSCQMDTLGNGMFCFTQNISVIDTMKPVISDIMSDTVYLHPDSACDAFFHIVADAFDCSGIRSIRNNSRFGVDTFANASGRYPRGLTPIRFIAEDSCCNADTQFIFIFVLDTIPPTISCQDQEKRIIGEGGSGMATFCVSELIATTMDNCDAPIDLRASFDPNDPGDTCVTYTCDSLMGFPMLMRSLTIFISDGSGNTSTCVAKVTVTDPFMACMGTIIGGQVESIHGEGIENAEVQLQNVGMLEMTDENGAYSFEEMESGEPYTVSVSKSDDPMNGVSTKDVILMQRHLLGIEEFTTPYQYLAADLNGSNSVEVGDIVRLRKLILGRIAGFPNVPDWYFVYDQFKFFDDAQPLSEKQAFEYFIDTLDSHMNLGFIGVKPGDIDGSAIVNGLQANGTREMDLVSMDWTSSSSSSGKLSLTNDKALSGAFLSLRYNADNIKINQVRSDENAGSQLEYDVDNQTGILKILWTDVYPNLDSCVFTIDYQRKSLDDLSFELSEEGGLFSEALNADLEQLGICWKAHDDVELAKEDESLMVEQNRPNPFNSTTEIAFFTPMSDVVTLEVWDAAGRKVLERKIETDRGWHQLELDKSLLGEAGVYNYRIFGNSGSGTRRMLIIE